MNEQEQILKQRWVPPHFAGMPRRGIKSAKREEDRRHSDARRTKEAEVWENVDWETHNDESEEEEEEFVLDARSTEKRELNEDRGDEEVEEYSEEARAAAKAASSGVMLSAAQLERVLQVSLAEPSNKRKRGCSGNSDDSAKRPKKPGLTKVEREQQVWLHRLHLLCWLAHQLQLQEAIRSELLRARLLSLLPSRLLQRLLSGEEELDDGTLLALLRHLEAEFRPRAGGANAAGASSSGDWPERLERALAERCADDVELTVLACALLRALGFRARLVLSYSVLPARASRAAQPPPMPPAFAALELRPPAAPGWTHLRLRPAALRCPLSHADPARLPAPLRPPRPIARRSARLQSGCMSEEKEEEESEERGDARQEVTSEKDSEEEEAPEGGTGGRPAADGKPRARRGGPSPVAYVVGADERGCFRDLTPRYACEYTSRSLPLRPADPAGWWEQALASVQKLARAPAVATGASQPALEDVDEQAEHVAEEQELAALAGDLPRTQAALRQHPLYVLEKQIGAYEIAWPPDCAVGQLPCGQRIFPRANLRRLRTAEGWLKEGMQVRTGEQPIKRVRRRGNEKARRTRELRRLEEEGRLSEAPPELLDPHSQQEVELFGEWQIEVRHFLL